MKRLIALILALVFIVGCSGDPEIKTLDLMNGSGTESIGKVTQVIVPESDVTDEYINQWYNKIKDKGTNYDLIIYKESINGNSARGVYRMVDSLIYKGVGLEKTSDGTYMVDDMDNAKEIRIK